ncbi:MAG: hypothetical protein JWM68_3461, partial [Verrucomicrobiales bacterium]|nr:hypothetical protein [Verrucomicrobiales bacterium]
ALTIGIQLSALVLQWVNMAGTLNSSINGMEWSAYTAIQAVSTVIEPLFTAAALAWFGMWMGLTTSKASTAVIKTFVFVVVIPTVALGIAQISIQMTISFTFLSKASASSAKWIAMLQPIIALLLSVAANVVFIVLARRKLFPHFRELAAGETIRRIRRSDLTQNAPPIVQPK